MQSMPNWLSGLAVLMGAGAEERYLRAARNSAKRLGFLPSPELEDGVLLIS